MLISSSNKAAAFRMVEAVVISRRTALLALLSGLAIHAKAQAQSLHGRHFVVVWGYEGAAGDPTEAHTFAAFYRGDEIAGGKANPAIISWLPATGIVRFDGVERGKNFSLSETLALARSHGFRLAAFGPYEISAENFANALVRIRLLNSGKIAYTMINGPEGAMNCIEAAGSLGGPINTGLDYGFAASAAVAQHLASSTEVDREVAERLHLNGYLTTQHSQVQNP